MTSKPSMMSMTHPLTPLYLQRSASLLSPATRCRLDFIAQFGPCSLDTLHGRFCMDSSRRERDAFRSGLFNLTKTGYLEVSGHKAERRWQIGFGVNAAVQNPDELALPPAMRTFAGLRTPARQYDVMYGPVYVPGPSAAPRAGSLDFMRLASHGYGC